MPFAKKKRGGPRKHWPRKGKGTRYRIVCSQCGKEDKIPFKPQSKNVLCERCYRENK